MNIDMMDINYQKNDNLPIDFEQKYLRIRNEIKEYEKEIESITIRSKQLETKTNNDEAKRLLFEIPNLMTNLDNIKLSFETDLRTLKLLIDGSKEQIKFLKSEIKNETMEEYRVQIEKYKEESRNALDKILGTDETASVKKAFITEIVKVLKPEKPTQAELDDIAATSDKVKEVENKIDVYQKQAIELSNEIEGLKVKLKYLENLFISIRKYASIVSDEMYLSRYQK